jgi:hypothetical protein
MTPTADSLPNDVETLKAMVIAAHAARLNAEAEARARALLIEQMKCPPERGSPAWLQSDTRFG